MEWLTWLQIIILPAIIGLFVMIQKVKSDVDERMMIIMKSLSQTEIDMAKNYVSNYRLDTLEKRITDHLIRIENKIEAINNSE